MFEGPLGSATRKQFLDSSVAVLFLAAPILFGYAVLAPDRIGLRFPTEHRAELVGAAITPGPVTLPSMPSAIPSPVVTPVSRTPSIGVRPMITPPPLVVPLPSAPDVPRVTWPPTVSGRVHRHWR